MQIIDLTDEHKELFALCLEDWSDDAKEAGPTRGCWVDRFQARGLRGKLALDDEGAVGGMIQYLPIEHSFVDGEGLYAFLMGVAGHGLPYPATTRDGSAGWDRTVVWPVSQSHTFVNVIACCWNQIRSVS